MIWTAQELGKALSQEIFIEGKSADKTSAELSLDSSKEFGKLQFNSKDIQQGDIFIALQGVRDGHDFVSDALQRGASIAIVSKAIDGVDRDRLIIVNNTFEALMDLAEYKRRSSKAKFIAITGSVGKTSTKEAAKIMLSAYGKTYASYGNFNNHLGVPLCLASMPSDIEYAIIEMGMSAKGEISELSKLVIPDIALITSISEGHIASFNSIDEITDAKCEIFEGLDINEGIAIVNRDIKTYDRCIKNIDRANIQNVKTYGKHEAANVRSYSSEILEGDLLRVSYIIQDEELELSLPLIPIHLAENFAGAFAILLALKLDIEAGATAISTFTPAAGRGGLASIKGDKNYRIICDYYNANPESMKAAIEYISLFDNKNKFAILGDMLELGKFERELHLNLVPYIVNSGIKKLFLIGERMKLLCDEFESDIEVLWFKDSDSLVLEIDKYISGGELILIKGSRGMKLEKIASRLGVQNAI